MANTRASQEICVYANFHQQTLQALQAVFQCVPVGTNLAFTSYVGHSQCLISRQSVGILELKLGVKPDDYQQISSIVRLFERHIS
ncbi:hypothetical protein HRE53_33235 (plasmid) [Acaryochloris sp. 'Moss Beach']|uniref:hypothetical protein n=1 Tax=Acaryochloris sp. 'Moss Beach' TaxID=2740837 RepID=UPI001F169ADB|nr:hypothetical protein [Acaryochloris sp. 'Moss Beach']UJB73467.1 hypothetical protein HRE53_33235 [Acaryochloris sp. 'Moss Beach']